MPHRFDRAVHDDAVGERLETEVHLHGVGNAEPFVGDAAVVGDAEVVDEHGEIDRPLAAWAAEQFDGIDAERIGHTGSPG